MSSRLHAKRLAVAAMAVAAAVLAAAPAASLASVDPAHCDSTLKYDPRIPTWDAVFADGHNPDAHVPFASGPTGSNANNRNLTAVLYEYMDALARAAEQTGSRVRVVKKDLGPSELGSLGVAGRDIAFYVVGTADHIARLDGAGGDAEFWSGVRNGSISQADGLAAVNDRPAFGWVTATPHGNEPAAGEAIARETYELVARTDCANARRLDAMDIFLMPIRNPDGRDNIIRVTPWSFDPNRDFGTRNQLQNRVFIGEMNKYPGVFYIDAHQQDSGYFFPPNEDPVLHEISDFSLQFIQKRIGPALQLVFNDQSGQYRNYNTYDLFTPEYGDVVPSLIMGAAGMTYEKGRNEVYGKQVYDHYLAMDETINLTADDKPNILTGWVQQWQQAIDQGAACKLQDNKLVSPLHDVMTQQPNINVCGYFYRPDQHSGDVSVLIHDLTELGVHVYKIDRDTAVGGLHEFGHADTMGLLPAGTLWIPMAQSQKHWIQAVLGEDPFIPYPYFYDVVTWSYSLQRGLAGDGFLTQQLPDGTPLTEIANPDFGTAPPASSVYAFNTDSMQGLALIVDLLDKGVNVYRGSAAFDAAGVHFFTGTALVDGASAAAQGVDLATLSGARQTPIYGLARYPVAHYQMVKPKIGVYTGTATMPNTPLNLVVDPVTHQADPAHNGMCNTDANTSSQVPYCTAMFTLTQKEKLPQSMVSFVTSTDVSNGVLVSGHYTALINTTPTAIPIGTGVPPLQTFVNGGGIYVGGQGSGAPQAGILAAITSARSALITNLNTSSISGLSTPGSTFDGKFDTSDPVAWGFDNGGWIYRDANGNATFTIASLTGSATIPNAKAAVSYGGDATHPLRSYGYQVNGVGPGRLDGRPAVVDQPFGAGHAIMMGFDPFFRAWKELDEREVLNAVLYPLAAELPATAAPVDAAGPDAGSTDTGEHALTRTAVQGELEANALPARKLTHGTHRPVSAINHSDANVRIEVPRAYLSRLRVAVRLAQLPRRIARKVVYLKHAHTAVLIIKDVRTADQHAREPFTHRLTAVLKARGIPMISAQL
jgi:hypothetical protein